MGTTALILCAIEDDVIDPDALALASPVEAIKAISRDPTLGVVVERSDGRKLTAVEYQWEYLEIVKEYLKTKAPEEIAGEAWPDEIVSRWEYVLSGLEEDPRSLARDLDWVAKLEMLDAYRERDGLGWGSPRLRLIDLQYHDVDPARGLYHRLLGAGRVERIVGDDEIQRAVTKPPEDTRAWFRGECLARYVGSLVAASWDGLIFDLEGQTLKRVPMMDPLRGTREATEALLDANPDPVDLLAKLEG
jgi:proteasome accessory factor A